MTRFIAKTGLLVASLSVALANYWFTFGLWPKSWLSFVACGSASVVIILLGVLIEKEGGQLP